MIKTILVPATGSIGDDAAFAAAIHVARRFGAELEILHVRLDPAEIATAMASDVGGGLVSAGLIERLDDEAGEREKRAKQSCAQLCAREGIALDAAAKPDAITAHWHREIGRETEWVAEYGRTSDLLVVARPDPKAGGVLTDTLEAALLDTGRPLLIPGTAALSGETIAIAWKSTREAARAVAAAAPFLDQAKRIVILTASEGGRLDREAAERLSATLRRRGGVAVEIRQLDPDAGPGTQPVASLLLDAASKAGAGLLVMGGYGHSRLREMVFGGVTETILHAADLAVLMAH